MPLNIKSTEKPKCIYCDRPLHAFGSDRKNGMESYGHWQSRTLHKKCLDDYNRMILFKAKIKRYQTT